MGGRVSAVSETPGPRLEEEQEVYIFLREDRGGIPLVAEEYEARTLRL